jgi:cysteine-rich repeat protein
MFLNLIKELKPYIFCNPAMSGFLKRKPGIFKVFVKKKRKIKIYKKCFPIILMRWKEFLAVLFLILSISFVPAPHLTSVSWNMTEAVEGQPVRLNLEGAGVNGREISFRVLERDAGGTDDNVIANPPNMFFVGDIGYTTWIAEWQSDKDEGQTNPPEYYFTATVITYPPGSMTSSTADADMLKVYTCGDGLRRGSEECDDGNTANNDGCSSTCTIEGGWVCDTATPNVCTPIITCGNNIREGTEKCDGTDLDGETCASLLGSGYTGTLSCNSSCGFNISVCSSDCDLTDAYWNITEALVGQPVRLNLEGVDCNGKTITFEIREDDFLSSDFVANPLNIVFGSPNTYGDWIVKWVNDKGGLQENPPEYYFIARVQTTAESETSPRIYDDMLKVENIIQCIGVNYCSDYTKESTCESDMCNVGEHNAPRSITCGETFDIIPGCNESTDCGCNWNESMGRCESDWDSKLTCTIGTQEIGSCSYTENGGDSCEEDGILTRSLIALWEWAPGNEITQNDPSGIKSRCIDLMEIIRCPASAQVSFFKIENLIITTIVVILIYVVYFIHKKKKKVKKKIKKRK